MKHKWYGTDGDGTRQEWDGRSESRYAMWSECPVIGVHMYCWDTQHGRRYMALVAFLGWRREGCRRRTTVEAVKDAERLAEVCLADVAAAVGLLTGRLREPADVYDD